MLDQIEKKWKILIVSYLFSFIPAYSIEKLMIIYADRNIWIIDVTIDFFIGLIYLMLFLLSFTACNKFQSIIVSKQKFK